MTRNRCRVPMQGGRASGFTLIELLVACALMAVLALLSWRGLDSILQTRERLMVASDELRSLTLAFSQMDEDILRSWSVNLLKLNESQLRVNVSGQNNAQSLHLIREVSRSGFPTRVQRVVYEVRNNQLARGFSEFAQAELGGRGGSAVGGGAVQSMIWQPILGGVRSIAIRGWVDGRGWMDATNLSSIDQQRIKLEASATGAAAGAAAAGMTPAAQAARDAALRQLTIVGVEVVLERIDGQRFVRVFSVRD